MGHKRAAFVGIGEGHPIPVFEAGEDRFSLSKLTLPDLNAQTLLGLRGPRISKKQKKKTCYQLDSKTFCRIFPSTGNTLHDDEFLATPGK
jgi:hypothetical protein